MLPIGALIAAFAISNSQEVKVRWIFGDAVQVPLIVVIVIALVAGLIIGWVAAKLGSRHSTE